MSCVDGARFATPERSVISPSGRYRLGVVTGEYSGEDGTGGVGGVLAHPDTRPRRPGHARLPRALQRPLRHRGAVGRAPGARLGEVVRRRHLLLGARRQGRWKGDGLNPEKIWRAEPPPPKALPAGSELLEDREASLDALCRPPHRAGALAGSPSRASQAVGRVGLCADYCWEFW